MYCEVGSASEPTPQNQVRAVFIDATGLRWRRVRCVAALLAVLAVAACTFALPRVLAPVREPNRHAISVLDTGTSLPVVGRGPVMRVLEVVRQRHTRVGRDPFASTSEIATMFSDTDIAKIGTSRYVIQRYGYEGRETRTISLTFEAGPHPEHTPRLLRILAENNVKATFFLTGQLIVRNPELVRRIVAEGHAVSNLTLTYVNLNAAPGPRQRIELILADRVLRALPGRDSGFVRLPYTPSDDAGIGHLTPAILAAQRWGYVVAGFDHDAGDLAPAGRAMKFPPLSGRDVTLLLHDGGANNRERMHRYVERLVPLAKSRGYEFTTMPQANSALASLDRPAVPDLWDRVALAMTTLAYDWAAKCVLGLFGFAGSSQ